jgi:hypothetical protein
MRSGRVATASAHGMAGTYFFLLRPKQLRWGATSEPSPPRHLRHPRPSDAALLKAIKAIHTLAWFSIEACMVYVLYAGFAGRSDRKARIAAGVVAGESVIFAANGFRCPLTQLAERLGAERGSVTDIYLPGWFAHNLPAIHAPLIVLAGFLHARSLRHRRRRSPRATARRPA